jgi:hypothetical protein
MEIAPGNAWRGCGIFEAPDEMIIDTANLRRCFEALVNHLEETGQAAVEVPWDFYWEASRDDLYNPYAQPTNLTLGQLSDDWSEMLKIADGEMPPVGYALVWLSSILRAAGEASEQ